MAPSNLTKISEFLLGFSEESALQPLIFGLFLSMYLVTVFGNLLIILAVISDSHLHTPMYFFLSSLSFVDICFTSTTIPKMLQNIWKESKAITYEGCFTQMHFFILFAGLDDFFLTVMAYDRFVAICHPLHYTVIMNPQLCVILILVSWVISVLHSLIRTFMVSRLSFCRDVLIIRISVNSNSWSNLPVLTTSLMKSSCILQLGYWVVVPSQIYFTLTVRLLPPYVESHQLRVNIKHFLHVCLISVVSLFYGSYLEVYLSSAATHSSHSSTIVSVMYTVVTPMLNLFIYSLRNKGLKRALQTFFRKAALKRPMVVG